MKLTDIFWSLLILTAAIFLPALFYRNNSKLGGGLEIFAFYLLLWIITSIISPILLALLKLKVIKSKPAFTITLLAIFNLYFGSYGVWLAITGQKFHPRPVELIFFMLNLLWAMLIILYAARNTPKISSGSASSP